MENKKKVGNITLEEIKKEIINSKSIFLTSHINPDGDAIGSVLALYLMIQEYNKKYIKNEDEFIKVDIAIDDKLPKYIQKFEENYLIKKIDEIEDKEYDLFISLDCANSDRYGNCYKIKEKCKKSINIDHHISNKLHAQYNYVEDICSTTELMYPFLEIFEIEITKKIAEYIYLGIINDTGNFRHDNVTENTFYVCSKLIKAGMNNHEIANIIFATSIKKVNFFGDVYKNKEINDEYKFIHYFLEQDKIKELEIEKDDTDGAAELILKIEDMELSLFAREEVDGSIKGSLRSNDKYDVNKIASLFGGGGHIKAAGFKVDKSFEEIKNEILEHLKNEY